MKRYICHGRITRGCAAVALVEAMRRYESMLKKLNGWEQCGYRPMVTVTWFTCSGGMVSIGLCGVADSTSKLHVAVKDWSSGRLSRLAGLDKELTVQASLQGSAEYGGQSDAEAYHGIIFPLLLIF